MPSKIRMRSKPIQSQSLFFATSPRTPFKAIAEIKLFDEELHQPRLIRRTHQT